MASTRPQLYHRLPAVLRHVPRYAIDGPIKLARDVGIGKTTIYDIIHRRRAPGYWIVIKITHLLGVKLGKRLHTDDLFSLTGDYPTSACEVCGCKGCLPDEVFNPDGSRKPEYAHLKGGDFD